MNVVFTARAQADLREILAAIASNYPGAKVGFETRLRDILEQIGRWPKSALELQSRPGVRMVPMVRYPYHLFYTIGGDTIEILHIRYGARATERD